MARTGISREQVFAAADELVAEGKKVTLKTLREALGTGSPNTIHAHLQSWKLVRPQQNTPARGLPSALIDAINSELERMTTTIRTDLEAQLDEAQRTANQLAESGTALEDEIAELREFVANLTSERDRLDGKSTEQADELTKLRVQIERERQAAEAARMDTATEKLKAENNVVLLTMQGKELERVQAQLSEEQNFLRKAEQANARLLSEKASLTERLTEVVQRDKSTQEKLSVTEERERQTLADLSATRSALEGAKATLEATRQESAELKSELKALKTPTTK